jgi:uncharacterized protein
MPSDGRPKPWRRSRRLLAYAAILVALGFVLRITGVMESFFYVPKTGPTPVPSAFPGAEAVTFPSADGTTLSGWFLPARNEPGGPRAPTVIHAHGNAGNMVSHLGFTEFLPGAGFNLFLFDYRGYGESDGSARHRRDLIDDTCAALDAMLERGDVDPRRVGLFAQSLGGSIGLNAMAEREEFRAAVIVSAFDSWRDMAAAAVGGEPPAAPARWLAWLLIRDHHRPDDAIRRIDRPILVLHGDHDRIVPVENGRRLAEHGPTAELVELRGGRHNTLRDTHPEFDDLTIGFLRRHLTALEDQDD